MVNKKSRRLICIYWEMRVYDYSTTIISYLYFLSGILLCFYYKRSHVQLFKRTFSLKCILFTLYIWTCGIDLDLRSTSTLSSELPAMWILDTAY